MSKWGTVSFAAVLIVVASMVQAADPRCARPPYGGAPDRYRAIVETYGAKLGEITKSLEEVCKMKFDGADRSALYKLQFKDEEIERMNTEALTLEMIKRTEAGAASK